MKRAGSSLEESKGNGIKDTEMIDQTSNHDSYPFDDPMGWYKDDEPSDYDDYEGETMQ